LVWLSFFHDALDQFPLASVSIAELWHVLLVAHKHGFDPKRLSGWFVKWYGANRDQAESYLLSRRQMLFPCFAFEHTEAFLQLTKWMVYNSQDNLVDHIPAKVTHQLFTHDSRDTARLTFSASVEQLHAARGRLRTFLHERLFTRVGEILSKANCDCKEYAVFHYLRELREICVWPLEDELRKASISEIPRRMQRFNGTRMESRIQQSFKIPHLQTKIASLRTENAALRDCLAQAGIALPIQMTPPTADATDSCLAQSGPCRQCTLQWDSIVNYARGATEAYFDGLCRLCMKETANVDVNVERESEFWKAFERTRKGTCGCGRLHGQPSSYFSFMGRKHTDEYE
jgi:hypothetical protein